MYITKLAYIVQQKVNSTSTCKLPLPSVYHKPTLYTLYTCKHEQCRYNMLNTKTCKEYQVTMSQEYPNFAHCVQDINIFAHRT